MNMYPPIFISGPHGGGKSTLVDKLKNSSDLFLENDFDIDFTIDFPSISSLSHFERSLVRLYHRFFIAGYAQKLAKENPGKVILTNRTIYDSDAYINAYHKLKWISEDQFQKLNFVVKNFTFRPYAIILNPPLEIIKNRLDKRRNEATRINRDKIFKDEDSDILETIKLSLYQVRLLDRIKLSREIFDKAFIKHKNIHRFLLTPVGIRTIEFLHDKGMID